VVSSEGAARHFRFLWILVSCSFAVRLTWLLAYPRVIENEGAQYARLAQNLLSGSGYQDMRGPTTILTPLYSLLMGGLSLLIRNMELSGRMISLLLGSFVPLIVYFIVDRIYGNSTARVAGLFAVAHPLFIALSGSVYSEGPYIFFLLVALYWTLVVFHEGRFAAAIWAGVFAGLAYLIRPEGLLYAILFAAWLAAAASFAAAAWFSHAGFGAVWRRSVTIVCASLVIAAPFIGFLSSDLGHFSWEGKSPTNDVLNLRLSEGMSYHEAGSGLGPNLEEAGIFLLNSDLLIAKYYPVSTSQKIHLMTHGLSTRFRALIGTLLRASYLGSPVIFLLAIAGLLGGPWHKIRIAHEALLCCMALLVFLILTSMHFLWDRFLFLALPIVMIWSARGAVNCAKWFRNALNRVKPLLGEDLDLENRQLVTMACAILLIPVLLSGIRIGTLGEFAESRWIQEKDAGRWIAAHAPASGKLITMSLDMITAYYAGATVRLLPQADSPTAVAYIHRISPNFVILWGEEKSQTPYVGEWMRKGIPDPCAQLAYQEGSSMEDRVVVYAWRCEASEVAQSHP